MEIFRSKHPLVSRRNPSIQQWPLISWTIEDWIQALNDIRFLFRAHSKQDDRTRIQWEKAYIVRFHGTLKGLVKWQQNQTDDREPDKPSLAKSAKLDPEEFDLLDPSLHWVYSSYNHLNVILKEDHLLLKAIDWSLLGLSRTDCEQFDSRRSTIWIGTEGACTPCHFDTYGYNVVVQIKGRKRWILFDPKWTNHLYPTRIPFEESSVFSRVNILNPDLKEHPLFEQVQACHVELNPGDVLYVPSHWWHFVQVIPHPDDKVSISLNLWCKHRDQFNHLQESVVQFLLTALLPTYDYTESSPPGDNDLFHVPRINDHFQLPSPNEALSMTSSMVRHAQVFEDLPDEDDQFENYNPIDVITTEEMGHILNWDQKIETTESKRSFLTNLYDALLSPDVIELVCKKLVANQKETD